MSVDCYVAMMEEIPSANVICFVQAIKNRVVTPIGSCNSGKGKMLNKRP